ncbi:TadE/TadG family type IV pilus assembly protein [Saccharothrix obliqua]|uniref:TadE/TadG family type IV pilus assembly protein n=1 Tax=Saccharothrix obliqua TaxID=2861747 RepID=UPI001C5F41F7|nr:TadE/TadG family type IV pilus assembly protein [Saccharothrix obliqua]MBW4717367.1 pilus assembly protein [Saccharothrix obliqua]
MTTPTTPFRHGHDHQERRKWWRSDDGSVAAELTIATPFLVMLLVFVAVLIHRGVDARIRIDDAAHQAARAAGIERAPTAATTAAHTTAANALSNAGVTCASLAVTTSTGDLRPGGTVTVTVSCQVDLGDALILGVPATTTLKATAVEPVDLWRSTASTGNPT